MRHLRVATFNTWNCQGHVLRRLPLMIAGLKALDADIILLQEVFAAELQDLHVGMILAEKLGLSLRYAPARKKIRKMDDKPTLGHSGLAILSKIQVTQAQIIALPSDDRDGQRIGQRVRLDMNGCRLDVGNVHLTHLEGACALRRQQLEKMAGSFNGDCDVEILGGDMNAPHGDGVFKVLADYQASGFISPPPLSTLNPSVHQASGSASGRIDHIFVRARSDLHITTRARTALYRCDQESGLYPSDHMAVCVDVTIT